MSAAGPPAGTIAAGPAAPGPNAPGPTAPGLGAPSPAASTSTEEDIRDIRGPKALPGSWLLPAILVGAVLLAVIAFLLWRRTHARPTAALSLTEETLQRLEAIKPLMWPASAREFGIAASEIVRVYVEKRFAVVATQRTTEEFLQSLLHDSHDSLARNRPLLAEFLQLCDFVKFAGGSLTARDMDSLFESARKFVLETGQPQAT